MKHLNTVLESLLNSSVPEAIKSNILRNCIALLNSLESLEPCKGIVAPCLVRLFSKNEDAETIREELKEIIKMVVSSISCDSMVELLEEIRAKLSSLSFSEDSLRFLKDVRCEAEFRHKLDRLRTEQSSLKDLIYLLHLSESLRNVEHDFELDKSLAAFLEDRIGDPSLIIDLDINVRTEAISCLLDYLAHLRGISTNCDTGNLSPSIVDLGFLIAGTLVQIAIYGSSSELDDSSSLISYSTSLLQDYLCRPIGFDTCFLPLASLLFQLDSSICDGTQQSEGMNAFICSFFDSHIAEIDDCLAAMRRLTSWLLWPEPREDASPLDKWITGFHCEFFKRYIRASGSNEVCLPLPLKEYLVKQLQFLFHLLSKLPNPPSSILNSLTFLALAGGLSSDDFRLPVIVEGLVEFFHRYNEASHPGLLLNNAKAPLVRLFSVSKLVCVSLHGTTAVPLTSPLCKVFQSFNEIQAPIRLAVESEVSSEALKSRLKVYQWPTLCRWGARAGINLRRCWNRWNSLLSDKERGATEVEYSVANSSVSDHHGLINTGNTCYANAALQLLYHCPDFRLAVLENQLTQVPSAESLSSCSKPPLSMSAVGCSPHTSSIQCSNSKLSFSPGGGLLHAQLFALFRALNGQRGSVLRDPGAVLTLSKPAHFVSGEQQDAVEYLSHLLEKLHEEEVEAQRNNSLRSNRLQMESRKRSSSRSSISETDYSSLRRPRHRTSSVPGLEATPEMVDSATSSSENNSLTKETSVVRRLFGGSLVRHTSCTECAHVSSTRLEEFSCLYLPISSDDLGFNDQPNEDGAIGMSSGGRTVTDVVDLTTLIRAHFTQTEYVPINERCEGCGKQTMRARRLSLQHLAPHVLICLKRFTFSRAKQTCDKIMQKVTIPERLTVALPASSDGASDENVQGRTDLESYNSCNADTTACGSVPDIAEDPDESPMDLQPPDNPPLSSVPSKKDTRPLASQSYILQGMILHHGVSISCGHYTCVARVGVHWISFDDDTTHYTTLEQVYAKPLATPYLLLYTQA
ncbi:unnamed protein product [Calicophoron daubneyi]|uniref:USP domain-containing protein n=1 Tax=Calicophoron daubneyi TaxID=300641 RepID=A0AAV2SYL4_CALDB